MGKTIEEELKIYAASQLTAQEINVIDYLVNGLTNKEISERLSISLRTVESHCANIYSKLNLRNRGELVYWYCNGGKSLIQSR
jgi:DNA-binding NarL/FixJ family response regulator